MDAGNRKSVVASLRWKELRERTFRARAGAAPLKRNDFRRLLPSRRAFRARAGAAPLKLKTLLRPQEAELTFRARAGAAPLKHCLPR